MNTTALAETIALIAQDKRITALRGTKHEAWAINQAINVALPRLMGEVIDLVRDEAGL